MKKLPVILTLFFVLFLSTTGAAVSQALTVSGMQNLDFGSEIFPGIEKSVSRTEATAAKYEITGEGGREVQITFQLPDYLTDASGNTLTISFASDDAGYNNLEGAQSLATAFDPNTGVITSLGPDGFLYIWLGGTVIPLHSQPGNFYDRDITMDVSYTN